MVSGLMVKELLEFETLINNDYFILNLKIINSLN